MLNIDRARILQRGQEPTSLDRIRSSWRWLLALPLLLISNPLNDIPHALAAPLITQLPVPTAFSAPWGSVATSDGSVWFVENSANQIGHILPDGKTITELAIPTPNSRPQEIAAAPDGSLWFTEFYGNNIGHVSADGKTITEVPMSSANSEPSGVVVGLDGSVWFTEAIPNKVGHILPDGKTLIELSVPTDNSYIADMAVTSDGSVWFIERAASRIGHIAPDGKTLTELDVPTPFSAPNGITASSDGSIWFTEKGANKIGHLAPDGKTITELAIPTAKSMPLGIAEASDGSVWFTESNTNKIGHIAPDGKTITELPIPTAIFPNGITVTPDGSIWFTESYSNKIGKIVPRVETTTTLNAPSASLVGHALILTASVAPIIAGHGSPTGLVSFLDGGMVLGTGMVDGSGRATLTTTSLALGTHTLTATYAGDTIFDQSGNTLTQTVYPIPLLTSTDGTITTSVTVPQIAIDGFNLAQVQAYLRPADRSYVLLPRRNDPTDSTELTFNAPTGHIPGDAIEVDLAVGGIPPSAPTVNQLIIKYVR